MSPASDYEIKQHFWPCPPAGAMYPVKVVWQPALGQPVERVLVTISFGEELAQNARTHAGRFFATGKAVLSAFVDEAGKTAAKYASEQSLVWCDAGDDVNNCKLVGGRSNTLAMPLAGGLSPLAVAARRVQCVGPGSSGRDCSGLRRYPERYILLFFRLNCERRALSARSSEQERFVTRHVPDSLL